MTKQALLESIVDEWNDVTGGTGIDEDNPHWTQHDYIVFRLEQEATAYRGDPIFKRLARLLLKDM